jgi:hypothetical protein
MSNNSFINDNNCKLIFATKTLNSDTLLSCVQLSQVLNMYNQDIEEYIGTNDNITE